MSVPEDFLIFFAVIKNIKLSPLMKLSHILNKSFSTFFLCVSVLLVYALHVRGSYTSTNEASTQLQTLHYNRWEFI